MFGVCGPQSHSQSKFNVLQRADVHLGLLINNCINICVCVCVCVCVYIERDIDRYIWVFILKNGKNGDTQGKN